MARWAYVVYFAPVLSVCQSLYDPHKARQELFGKRIDGVGSWLIDNLAAARRNIESEEVFHRLQVRSLSSFLQTALSGLRFTRRRQPLLSKTSLHVPEILSSEPALGLTSYLAGGRATRTTYSDLMLPHDPS